METETSRMAAMCKHWTIDNEDVMNNLEKQRYDVAVVIAAFYYKCTYLIPHRLKIPSITLTFSIDPFAVRSPWLPSFVPHERLPLTDQMSFSERVKNTIVVAASLFLTKFKFPDPPEDLLERYRQYGPFNTLDDLMSRSAFWLIMRDDVLDYGRPMMPNMVNIGGLTVKKSRGEIPAKIREFIDGSKRGTILVTFGSLVSTFPAEIVDKFSSAFRRLDGYRVIWRQKKTEGMELPGNVMVADWVSQSEILAHPRTRLFITHCGSNSQFEAVHHAVPMIGFPLFSDQPHNAARMEHKGYGLTMNIFDFSADQLLSNINNILTDKSYKERVTKASQIFRGRVQSPVERASYWVEHICEYGGEHLRSAGNDLPLYSYLMLDVLAFFLLILAICLYVLVKLVSWALRKICARRRRSEQNSFKKTE